MYFDLVKELEKSIEENGMTHSKTIEISQELDKHVLRHQRLYNKLKENGYIEHMVQVEQVRRRKEEVRTLALKANENLRSGLI